MKRATAEDVELFALGATSDDEDDLFDAARAGRLPRVPVALEGGTTIRDPNAAVLALIEESPR